MLSPISTSSTQRSSGLLRPTIRRELTAALAGCSAEVRGHGVASRRRVPDSDLILPAADSTVADVRALLNPKGAGLIPG